jgi:undecaprenyl-diphosphatase
MLDFLVEIDKTLFIFLNSLHTPIMDKIMWAISGKYTWIPLYAAVLYWFIRKYKWNALWITLFAILVVVANDQISVAIKFAVERPRPSHNEEFEGIIHLVNNYHGGAFGFVSSHAANTFGFAVFSLFLIRQRWFTIAILAWAAIVSYSRVYLGVHYPADITFGGLLGVLFGFLLYRSAIFSTQKWPIIVKQK